jgi:hypothetical protein
MISCITSVADFGIGILNERDAKSSHAAAAGKAAAALPV